MCSPILIGSAVGGLQTINSMQMAADQHDAQVGAYMANIEASQQAKIEADRQINLNEVQAQEKAAQEKIANDLQARQLVSRGKIAQAESGAIQNTNVLLNDMVRQGLVANNMISANYAREDAQRFESRTQQRSNYQSRINQVARPDYDSGQVLMGSLLSGAQAGLMAGMGAHAMGIGAPAAAATTTTSSAALGTHASAGGVISANSTPTVAPRRQD
jgi:hypothetical protein